MGVEAGDGPAGHVLFRVLGPFEVCVDGRVVELGGARIRTLLALLTVNAGRVTGVGALVEALWGSDAPGDAHRTVRTYVSRLRRSLAPADGLIGTHPAGYVLRLAPELLDAANFERLVVAGREALAAGRPGEAAERLGAALSLWRGDAYGEFGDNPMLRPEAARLDGLRVGATEDRIAAELATGAGAELVGELTALTERHPGHSRLWELLMTALYRSGRQADALAAFGRARTVLADRFGLDPSPRLAELHRQVLDNDARLLGVEAPVRAARSGRNDLPRDIADFAGRQDELDRLLGARSGLLSHAPTAVVIEAIDGMAGVGKTTLAVHAAHRLARFYPGGCLFIDLHGHASTQRAVTAMSALDTLLRALGVSAMDIPGDIETRAALWRAELATRSVLVVLDNAADAAQVRPLLPGTARSLALITSRRRLFDLESAQLLPLGVLPEEDAIALFTSIAGQGRSEAEAVRDVVRHCGRLPLAIRIAAARLRARPVWTVRDLADRLGKASMPLTELAAGDRSVAAAFSVSYDQLAEAPSRMFRLLGLNRGPDADVAVAAALAAVDRAEAERLLGCLVDVRLLDEPVAGRYRFHDLIRQHAYTVALAEEPETERQAALRRLTDFYLHTGYHATRQLDQQHPPIDLPAVAPGCEPLQVASDAAAMAWFDANHQGVLAARAVAEEQGWDTAVWQLAWTLDNYHYRRGQMHDNIASWRAGLAAAERLGDAGVQARAHRRLGLVYAPLGKAEADKAMFHLGRSLELSAEVGDVLGEAGAHFVLALAWTEQHDDHKALHHAINARHLYRQLASSKWEVRSLGMIGACNTRLGRHDEARSHCEAALQLSRQQKDAFGEADSLQSLGAIAHATGNHTDALDHYAQALKCWGELDNTYRQAGVLVGVGDTHDELGRPDLALAAWREAIDLYRAQDLHSVADRVDRRVAKLSSGSSN